MILNAYSLFDRKALTYSPPFFQATHGLATRLVSDLALDPNTTVGRHPADFVLYHVGRWDDSGVGLSPISPLVHVVDVLSLLPKPVDTPLFKETC